jgi:hypothetical protein
MTKADENLAAFFEVNDAPNLRKVLPANDDFLQIALRDRLQASLTLVAQIQSIRTVKRAGAASPPFAMKLATSTDATVMAWTKGLDTKGYALAGIAVRIRRGHRDRVSLKLSYGIRGFQPEFNITLRSWPDVDPRVLTETSKPSTGVFLAPRFEAIGGSYIGQIASVEILHPSNPSDRQETLDEFFR